VSLAPRGGARPGRKGKPRLLLVDDDAGILEYYRTILEPAYAVECAEGAATAVALSRAGRFDLVVSDIAMPTMDGFELMRAIRQRDEGVPIIFVTGKASLDDAITAIEDGVFRYFRKPVLPRVLADAVRAGVDAHRRARAARDALRRRHRHAGPALGSLKASFARALGTLWIALQPIVAWSTRRVIGYETLVRNEESALGRPHELFSAAERLGRVLEVGRAVRARAAGAMDGLPDGTRLFLNVHRLDLDDPEFLAPAAPLTRHASRVVLELTERDSVDEVGGVQDRLAALRSLGYRIALDDLGAGHNGLSKFATIRPDLVKLDQMIVRGLDRDEHRRRLVRSMRELCVESGIDFITEGVETPEERDALVGLGCDLFQGYLFGRPEPGFARPRF